ncbi:MAG: S8 family serine peptidase [bacterium]|nr:S8 family serine peptidase [bacterium]
MGGTRNKFARNRYKKYLWVVQGLFVIAAVFGAFALRARANEQFGSIVVKVRAGESLAHLTSGVSDRINLVSRVFPFSSAQELSRVYRLEVSSLTRVLADLSGLNGFEYVQEDRVIESAGIVTSDPEFTPDASDQTRQWWLSKIKVPEAWLVTQGSKEVDVAIIDTGIDGKHEDLNDGRVGSGYLTYCQVQGSASGQCLVHISSVVAGGENTDDNGHGTIIAGIIGGIPNNAKGIAGINWNVRLMPIKVLDSSGSGISSDVAAGIIWAVDNGADIINLSLGGTSLEGNPVLNNAITYAYDKSVLVVAAAGNDSALVGADLDIQPVYPVCNDGANNMVLGVGAVDANDKKASFSNYGRGCIDLVAPGGAYFNSREDQRGLVSTYFDPKQPTKNNLYVYASGSSMSSAIVAGVAALLKSKIPDLNAAALRNRLTASATNIDDLNTDDCQGTSCTGRLGSGRIDAQKALQSTTFTSNSLIRDSSKKVYLIEDGLRRSVGDFVFSQRGFRARDVKDLSVTESELLPLGHPLPPLDGTLLRSQTDPTVFVVVAGVLQPASLLAFRSYNYAFSQVAVLSDDEISAYRKGPDLQPTNGALLKLTGQPAVYFLYEGSRRLITAFGFKSRSLKFSDVVELDQASFDKYPEDLKVPLEPPQDGSLVKGSGSTIYVFESGILRALSAAAFAARSYQFSQVVKLSDSEISNYTFGELIN